MQKVNNRLPDASGFAEYETLQLDVSQLLERARQSAGRAVNAVMTATYWQIGRRIVEQDRPDAPYRRANSRVGPADRGAGARRCLPPWAWFWCSSGDVPGSVGGGAGCTGEPRR